MNMKIGILLPRSVEYPAMAFDLLDGLRINLRLQNLDVQIYTENIGFGESPDITHAAAEKLVINHDVQLLIAYATSLNAETLYSFAATVGKPILFLDAGMEIFEQPPHPLCRHLTLQGLMACLLAGELAGEGNKKVYAAASFLDGGYRGSWAFQKGIEKSGGMVAGHFVSNYQPAEFTLEQLTGQLKISEAQSVTASFSSYFLSLFLEHMQNAGEHAHSIPMYCSPFMADEQLLSGINFPGGIFHTVVPWATSLNGDANLKMTAAIQTEKGKTANIFHLLGWEAAIITKQILLNSINDIDGWSYESPRGIVTFHPETKSAYAALYKGRIIAGSNNRCTLDIGNEIAVSGEAHRALHFSRPDGMFSRWKNNFFCI